VEKRKQDIEKMISQLLDPKKKKKDWLIKLQNWKKT
jgi:hypothetical protein